MKIEKLVSLVSELNTDKLTKEQLQQLNDALSAKHQAIEEQIKMFDYNAELTALKKKYGVK